MIARSFSKALMGAALVASLAVSGPAMAQSQGNKEPVKPFKVDKLVPQHEITYAIDTDPAHDRSMLVLDLSNGGRVLIRLMPEWAPHHIERIKTLVRQGFYDGIIFHRVIEGFMAQTGDPTGTGQGGSKLPDLQANSTMRRTCAGRSRWPAPTIPTRPTASSSSCSIRALRSIHKYTNFGRVISGMDAVDTIVRGEPPRTRPKSSRPRSWPTTSRARRLRRPERGDHGGHAQQVRLELIGGRRPEGAGGLPLALAMRLARQPMRVDLFDFDLPPRPLPCAPRVRAMRRGCSMWQEGPLWPIWACATCPRCCARATCWCSTIPA
jgi:peptidylprolyl isomerase